MHVFTFVHTQSSIISVTLIETVQKYNKLMFLDQNTIHVDQILYMCSRLFLASLRDQSGNVDIPYFKSSLYILLHGSMCVYVGVK